MLQLSMWWTQSLSFFYRGNVEINDDHTALHLAVEKGTLEAVKYLVECGIDINVRDSNGHAATDSAPENSC